MTKLKNLLGKIYTPKRRVDYIIYSAIILAGILLDQLTKFLVFKFMTIGQSIPLIKGFLHITYHTNDGAAFGMMDSPGLRWIFLTLSTLGIIAFLLYLYLGNADSMLSGIALSMIISGGIGNMIERLGFGFYTNPVTGIGEVIDFIDFCGIWNAIFNGADSFICVGAGLLILALILEIVKEEKSKNTTKNKQK